MQIHNLHSWDLSPVEAIKLQKKLASSIITNRPVNECRYLAGADVSYNRFSNYFYAAVVVLDTSNWSIVERQSAEGEVAFPYVPGLLSFREAPMLIQAFEKLTIRPDMVMFDGQGLAHPRRMGIACHMGIWLEIPSFGCAKSRLIGSFKEPGIKRGSFSQLSDKDESIGCVLRTKDGIQPVYISAGHLIDLESARRWSLESSQGYRIPEPTRQAHLHVNEIRTKAKG